MSSTAAMPSGVTTGCAWPSQGQSVTELMPFMNFPVHPYTCCSDRHASPYWTFICRWISMGFTPSLLKKTEDRTLLFFGACCMRGRHLYTITALSCCIPASYCHLSATLQFISITAVNLQTIELWFAFLSHFSSFHLTLPPVSKGTGKFIQQACHYFANLNTSLSWAIWMCHWNFVITLPSGELIASNATKHVCNKHDLA